MVGYGKVEVEAGFCADVAVVASVAYVVMHPSDADNSIDCEGTRFAAETAECVS